MLWGIADGESWLNSHPVRAEPITPAFDRSYQPKAAFQRLVE
ncbi:MAG: endo-1,4-beta-xylanase [Treponema sp.]|nr:endo-1,4-beta-xylanase [Treponema sp.]